MNTTDNTAAWRPIDGMPAGAEDWRNREYERHVNEWHALQEQLKDPSLDKKIINIWTLERQREFAIETGEIEGLYAMPRGMTEQLITEGFDGARLPHAAISDLVDKDNIDELLKDQATALEAVFARVKNKQPLSNDFVKEMQALMTRHQKYAPTVTFWGAPTDDPLLKGEYKNKPNNPRRQDGVVHEYCPPERVAGEMDRLFELYDEIQTKNYPTAVEAAWLHHRFVQIHPFQDGNGRTARLLMAYCYVRRGEVSPVVTAEQRRLYIQSLELADDGNLRAFAEYLNSLAEFSILGVIGSATKTLKSSSLYRHSNGDVTYREQGKQQWKTEKSNGELL